MPRVGYGCASKASARYVERALGRACGSRHRPGRRVVRRGGGRGRSARLRRGEKDVTVVTKLHPKNHGTTTARRLIEESARFGGYVDVFLQHYPTCWDGLCGAIGEIPSRATGATRGAPWRVAYDEGKVKAIGVSNVGPREVDELGGNLRASSRTSSRRGWTRSISSVELRKTCEKHEYSLHGLLDARDAVVHAGARQPGPPRHQSCGRLATRRTSLYRGRCCGTPW